MADRAKAAVEVIEVSKRFGDGEHAVRALDRVSLALQANEFFTLLGPSGCGKTTLLRSIAGFEQPSEGEIFLYGEPLRGLPPFRRPVNTVFQSYALFPHLTVAGNVAVGVLTRPLAAQPARLLLLDVDSTLTTTEAVDLLAEHAGAGERVAEITERAPDCRFRDCTHAHEPGCAVQAAIADGTLDPDRLDRWRKLVAENRDKTPATAPRRLRRH